MSTANEFLEHYGVKGMKWGVRRKRGSGSSDSSSDITKLSNQELRDLVNRMQLEQQYRSMKRSSAGAQYATQLLSSAGKTAASVAVSAVTGYAVKKALDSMK